MALSLTSLTPEPCVAEADWSSAVPETGSGAPLIVTLPDGTVMLDTGLEKSIFRTDPSVAGSVLGGQVKRVGRRPGRRLHRRRQGGVVGGRERPRPRADRDGAPRGAGRARRAAVEGVEGRAVPEAAQRGLLHRQPDLAGR